MGTREKILFVLMVLALGYGAFELFYPSPRESPEEGFKAGEAAALDLARQVADDLARMELGPGEAYILELAAAEWPREPSWVMEREKPVEEPVREEGPGPLTYTGYLEINERRLAIINGIEYQVGEQVEHEGLVLLSITPERVELKYNRTGQTIKAFYME